MKSFAFCKGVYYWNKYVTPSQKVKDHMLGTNVLRIIIKLIKRRDSHDAMSKYVITKMPNQIDSEMDKCILLENSSLPRSLLEIAKMVFGRNDQIFMNGKLIKRVDSLQKIIHFDDGTNKSL